MGCPTVPKPTAAVEALSEAVVDERDDFRLRQIAIPKLNLPDHPGQIHLVDERL